jgi:hypothetical protein
MVQQSRRFGLSKVMEEMPKNYSLSDPPPRAGMGGLVEVVLCFVLDAEGSSKVDEYRPISTRMKANS